MLEERCVLNGATSLWDGSPETMFGPTGAPPDEDHLPVLIQQYSLFNPDGYLTGPTAGDPLEIALSYLRSRASDLGVTPADFDNVAVTTNYVTDTTGITHLGFHQTLNGIEIDNAVININVASDGRILNVGGGFVANVGQFATESFVLEMDALSAVRSAAYSFGVYATSEPTYVKGPSGIDKASVIAAGEISLADIPAKLEYVATPDGQVHLTWSLMIQTTDGKHWYDLHIGSNDGSVVSTHDFADVHADYNVYAIPLESPNHGGRSIETNPDIITPSPATVPSPFGWHDTNGVAGAEFTITRGNNANAYADTNNDNLPDAGSQPDGGPGLVFNFPINLANAPSTYQAASVTNLFYMTNILHDVHYLYGFNEAARNFQVNNYGRGGVGNDAVNAEAQDGGGTNNANFATPPDGSAPRMQMYLGNLTSPLRDGSLDNGVITHEYGHGVSNRLTNNGSGLGALQSGGMGEGWSDWWALMFSQTTAGETTTPRGMGTYLFGQAANGPGIRDYRYQFAIGNVALETFAHFGTGAGQSTAVHAAGTRWSSTLWDINHLLIQKYGFEPNLYNSTSSAGNIKALHLVMNGLKLQPSNPSFLAARDAILAADTALNGGANHLELWTAFARRGLGFSATTASSSSSVFNEAYDLPPTIGQITVTSTTPAANATVTVAPTSFVVNFSEPVELPSVQGSDFKVNGISATGFVASNANQTITFTYGASPVTVQGLQNMSIALDQIKAASNPSGPGNAAFSANFRFDATSLQVTSTTPPSPGGVFTLPAPFTYDVNFNEAIASGSVGTADLVLSQGTVTGAIALDADTARYTISGITTEGTLNITLPAGAVTDTFGNANTVAFNGTYQVDIGTVAYPALVAKNPLGSMIYDPSATGTINFIGDVDNFTINIDPNQTISIIVTPTTPTTLRPRVELFDPSNTSLGFAAAPAAGQISGIQTRATTTGGVYRISISGDAGTVGGYAVEVILNAAFELEGRVVGATNDTLGTAQDISGSFVNLDTTLAHASRGAVLGSVSSVAGAGVVNGSFETGNFTGWTTVTTNTPFVPWTVSPAGVGPGFGMLPTQPQDGTFVAWNGFDGSGPMQYLMFQDLAIPTGTSTAFNWKERIQWNFFTAGAQARTYFVEVLNPVTGGVLATLYSFSTGSTPVNVPQNTGWQSHSADLTAFGGSTIRVQFREVIPQANTGPGQIEFDAIGLASSSADWYRFSLGAGEEATLALESLTGSSVDVQLFDAAGVLVASGAGGPTNFDRIINFAGGPAGNYFARVIGTGVGTGTYSLVVTRNAVFDAEGNDSLVSAQDVTGTQGALGYLAASTAVPTTTTITFAELSTRPVNGVSLNGLTFGFTIGGVASTDALFGGIGPGATLHTTPPQLEGNTLGELTLDFASPSTSLQFGLVLLSGSSITNAATIRFFNAANTLIDTRTVNTAVPGGFTFSEALFSATPPSSFTRARVTFNSAAAARFVMDNIQFTTTTAGAVSAVVPNANATTEANTGNTFPLHLGSAGSQMRYQQIYSASQFIGGGVIDQLRFRRNGTDFQQPAFTTTGISIQINLSYAATSVGTVSSTFANNIGAGNTMVFNGLLNLSSSGVGNPNPFDVIVDVANTFNYNPALGDLLVDMRVFNSPFASVFLDAAGFGTQTATTRVYAGGNVNATSGTINFDGTPGIGNAYGLVTRFDFVGTSAQEDWYKVTLAAGETVIDVETRTRADGPGEFVNVLNPKIQLFNAAGVDITPSVTILGDGRNENFRAVGLTPGATYYVKLTAEGGTAGEYFAGIKTLRTPTPTVLVDNTNPLGFRVYGTGWNLVAGGHGGNYRTHAGNGTGANYAEWRYAQNFTAGTSYEFFVTWVANPANATNARYKVFDGAVQIATVFLNQTIAPNDVIAAGGTLWERVFVFTPSTTGFKTIRVQLDDSGNGIVVADALFDPPLTPEAAVAAFAPITTPAIASVAQPRLTDVLFHDFAGLPSRVDAKPVHGFTWGAIGPPDPLAGLRMEAARERRESSRLSGLLSDDLSTVEANEDEGSEEWTVQLEFGPTDGSAE